MCLNGNRLFILQNSDTNWTFVSGEHSSKNIGISIVLACSISRELMLSLRPASHGSQPCRKRRGCSIVVLYLLEVARLGCLRRITFWRLGGIFICNLTIGPNCFRVFSGEWTTVRQLSFGRWHLFTGPVFDTSDGVRTDTHLVKVVLFLQNSSKIVGLLNVSHVLVESVDLWEPWTIFSYCWWIRFGRKSFLASISHGTFETTITLTSLNSENFFLNLFGVNFSSLFFVFFYNLRS